MVRMNRIRLEQIPSVLNNKFKKKGTFFINNRYLISTYENTSDYVVYDIASKTIKTVPHRYRSSKIVSMFPYVVDVFECNGIDCARFYDVETEYVRTIPLWDEGTQDIKSLLCGNDNVVVVTSTRFNFIEEEGELIKGVDLKGKMMKYQINDRISKIEDDLIILVSIRSFQVWNLIHGDLLFEGDIPGVNGSILFLEVVEDVVFVFTNEGVFVFIKGSPEPTKIDINSPYTCVYKNNGKFISGGLDGRISLFDIRDRTIDGYISDSKSSAVSLQKLISAAFIHVSKHKDFVVSITRDGRVKIWDFHQRDSLMPLAKQNIRGMISSVLEYGSSFLVLAERKNREELWTIEPDYSKFFSSSDTVDSKDEIRYSGYLKSRKGKKHYFRLVGDALLEYKSGKDLTSMGSYVLNIHSKVVVAQKKKKDAFKVFLSRNEVIYFAAENSIDRDHWVKHIGNCIKDLKLVGDKFDAHYEDIIFDRDEDGQDIILSTGNLSIVYKGSYHGKAVAIKVFKNISGDLFKNEFSMLRSLRHPNIIEIIGKTSDPFSIIELYMEDGCLDDVINNLDRNKYSWKFFTFIAKSIADAMNYLHNFKVNRQFKPIIHKKLKSSNILVSNLLSAISGNNHMKEIQIKLADFGISAFGDEVLAQSEVKQYFLAPETIKEGIFSKESDVYCYGILIYELFCLGLPENGDFIVPSHIPKLPRLLFQECCSNFPSERPSFKVLRNTLRDFTVEIISKNTLSDPVIPIRRNIKRESVDLNNFSVNPRLYGRDSEISEFLKYYETFCDGNSTSILVVGNMGYGRSHLIQALNNYSKNFVFSMNSNCTYHSPYGALIEALEDFIITSESSFNHEDWIFIRNEINYAFDAPLLKYLGRMNPIILDLLPINSVYDSENIDSESLRKSIINAFDCIAQNRRSTIIFSDINNMDENTKEILPSLIKRLDNYMLIFSGTPEDVEFERIANCKISMNPLGLENVIDLLKENLGIKKVGKRLTKLARVMMDKTLGSPYFLKQFLIQLVSNKLIHYDENNNPIWNIKEIISTSATDNVSATVDRSIRIFSDESLYFLYLTSCSVTNAFNIKRLQKLQRFTISLENGSISLGKVYESEEIEEILMEFIKYDIMSVKSHRNSKVFSFQSNDIKNVIRSHILERELLHKELGNILKTMKSVPLYNVVSHLNYGKIHFDTNEKVELAVLNHKYAKLLSHSGYTTEVNKYLMIALELCDLDKDMSSLSNYIWEENFEFAFSLFSDLLDSEIALGLWEESSKTINFLELASGDNSYCHAYVKFKLAQTLSLRDFSKAESAMNAFEALKILEIIPHTVDFVDVRNGSYTIEYEEPDKSIFRSKSIKKRKIDVFTFDYHNITCKILDFFLDSLLFISEPDLLKYACTLWIKIVHEDSKFPISLYALFIYGYQKFVSGHFSKGMKYINIAISIGSTGEKSVYSLIISRYLMTICSHVENGWKNLQRKYEKMAPVMMTYGDTLTTTFIPLYYAVILIFSGTPVHLLMRSIESTFWRNDVKEDASRAFLQVFSNIFSGEHVMDNHIMGTINNMGALTNSDKPTQTLDSTTLVHMFDFLLNNQQSVKLMLNAVREVRNYSILRGTIARNLYTATACFVILSMYKKLNEELKIEMLDVLDYLVNELEFCERGGENYGPFILLINSQKQFITWEGDYEMNEKYAQIISDHLLAIYQFDEDDNYLMGGFANEFMALLFVNLNMNNEAIPYINNCVTNFENFGSYFKAKLVTEKFGMAINTVPNMKILNRFMYDNFEEAFDLISILSNCLQHYMQESYCSEDYRQTLNFLCGFIQILNKNSDISGPNYSRNRKFSKGSSSESFAHMGKSMPKLKIDSDSFSNRPVSSRGRSNSVYDELEEDEKLSKELKYKLLNQLLDETVSVLSLCYRKTKRIALYIPPSFPRDLMVAVVNDSFKYLILASGIIFLNYATSKELLIIPYMDEHVLKIQYTSYQPTNFSEPLNVNSPIPNEMESKYLPVNELMETFDVSMSASEDLEDRGTLQMNILINSSRKSEKSSEMEYAVMIVTKDILMGTILQEYLVDWDIATNIVGRFSNVRKSKVHKMYIFDDAIRRNYANYLEFKKKSRTQHCKYILANENKLERPWFKEGDFDAIISVPIRYEEIKIIIHGFN
eukprot:TRINITY_DN5475_c0_g1_i4.p1 TRINITY_DN5475_c0_g1~~TRINITY_DN5475_c0_g1_i4.p1  ORF type:complete len:2143 (-),score=349.31 TRINITY_DN5475_c0_g1_i4:55-6483(-)